MSDSQTQIQVRFFSIFFWSQKCESGRLQIFIPGPSPDKGRLAPTGHRRLPQDGGLDLQAQITPEPRQGAHGQDEEGGEGPVGTRGKEEETRARARSFRHGEAEADGNQRKRREKSEEEEQVCRFSRAQR